MERRYYMDYICPLCNGLYEISVFCPVCNNQMEDKGPVVNFLDSYSPYLLDEITSKVDGVPSYKCVHLFKCPICGHDKRKDVGRIIL